MQETPVAQISVFRLDSLERELTSDGVAIAIPPKATDLLLFLVENAGRVVSRTDLVAAVWDGLTVSNDAIRYAMKALRRGLGDPAAAPLFIETVARRGWRYVGRAVRVSEHSWILEGRDARSVTPTTKPNADAAPFVGRDAEMAFLLDRLSQAQAGNTRTLFVRGEPGIGKSRLLDAFLEVSNQSPGTLSARGECLEQIGPGMPYAPLFQVLEQLCEHVGREAALAILRQHAPTWLAQMPSLTEPDDRVSLEERVQGATQERMIRELAHAIERFASDQSIIVAIEDLQWADPSTRTAIFFLARRQGSSRLLIVATLRPEASTGDALGLDLDLDQSVEDLMARASCEVLSPSLFERDSIQAYLSLRFGSEQPPSQSKELCERLAVTSAGNPLFLVSLVDECVDRGLIHQRDGIWTVAPSLRLDAVPERLRPLIERQLRTLEPALLELLEVASIAGLEFSASEIAPALEQEIEEVEARCDSLVADGRFASARGAIAWPDGTVGSAYRFMHALHRDVLRERLSPGRRSRFHRVVGTRLLEGFAGFESEVAARLAMHFERGLDPASAARFYTLAGETSAQRLSNFEAVEHFRHALDLMATTEFEGRSELEIRARLAFCAPLASVAGYAADELERNLARLERLTSNIDDSAAMYPALLGLWSLSFVRADLERASALGERMLALAERETSPALRLQAHQSVGHCLFYRGEVTESQRHYDLATEGYDVSAHPRQDYSVGDDPLVLVLSCRALSCWFLGRSDEACRSANEAVSQGERLDHPPSLALAWTYGAVLHQLRDDVDRAATWSERSLEITTAEGIPFWMELSRIVRGWAIANADPGDAEQGIELIRVGISGWAATGSSLGLPHFYSILADALARSGTVDEGLELVGTARGLMEESGQWVFQSQIDRLTGDLFRRRAETTRDRSAIDTARSWYLTAADEAASRGLTANALQAWLALAEADDAGPRVERRLADLVDLYPSAAPMDLHLARARARLSREP